MTPEHDPFLELAAAAIDFELTPAERLALDDHLRSCSSCRRRAQMLLADARELAGSHPHVLSSASEQRIRHALRAQRHGSLATMRLVAIAALVALLALGAVAVGSELLRQAERTLPGLPIEGALRSSPGPSGSPSLAAGAFQPGTLVDVVVSGLRVRTAPTVDDSVSAKFEPLLATGARLRIVEGPITADGYDWYLVEPLESPQRGWVSAADHDGTPWISDPSIASPPAVALSSAELALIAGLRQDAALNCEHRSAALPKRAVAGAECRLGTALVVRVGAYRFASADDAMQTYLERLAGEGVKPLTGDCAAGVGGDRIWGQVDPANPDSPAAGRIGCFQDENGTANIRVTCGSMAVGVLGRQDQLAPLWQWAWSPVPPASAPAKPGICVDD